MSEILDYHKLKFSILEILGKKYGHCETEDSTYRVLSNFVSCIYWSKQAENIIIDLDKVLEQQISLGEFGTQTVLIESDYTNTYILDETNPQGFNNPDLTIPTIDFRDIMLEWKKFLEEINI